MIQTIWLLKWSTVGITKPRKAIHHAVGRWVLPRKMVSCMACGGIQHCALRLTWRVVRSRTGRGPILPWRYKPT